MPFCKGVVNFPHFPSIIITKPATRAPPPLRTNNKTSLGYFRTTALGDANAVENAGFTIRHHDSHRQNKKQSNIKLHHAWKNLLRCKVNHYHHLVKKSVSSCAIYYCTQKLTNSPCTSKPLFESTRVYRLKRSLACQNNQDYSPPYSIYIFEVSNHPVYKKI